MIGKKINQLATELAPVSTDLTIIGDPTTGVSKKITLAQLGAIFSGAVSFYTNLASFPATGDINVIYCAKDTQKLYLWSGSAYVEVFPSQALLDTYQLRSEKGNANGYASLDSQGKVPISQLPSSIMEYKGTWNAATNTPTLANGTGDTGDVYICNVAGTVNFGAGPLTFAVGDYVIYSGTIWQRSSGAVGTVTSVAVSRSGDALAITGSPVTTSGTINVGFAGNSTQYINGAGNLVTFPGVINEAQNLITEVYNKTGATLTKGTIVYINGGQGNLPTITKALATSDSTSAQTYGIVRNDITNNNNGYVVVAGRISDLDTQAYTEGTQLYLSPTTAGTFTSTKPYAPQHLVYVGIVVRAHPTQGVIEVKIQNGYEMDELHNVAAQSPDNNDILQYKTATSLWTKVAGTTTNIAEGTNLYYTDARSRVALSFTAGSGAYNSTTGVITIPTNTNQLTNGANYITLASLSASSPLSYNNGTGAFSISQANTSTNGFLSSTDWNTFNGKQAALNGTGFVKISGTTISYDNSTYYLASNPNAYIPLTALSAGAGISYNNTTGVIASTITQYTDANARAAISLTTSGTSGAATYNSTTGVLNVPQYAPDLSGYVPTSRTLTINGTAYDLSANRSWSVGTVTSVGLSSATSGVTIGSTPITTSGTITLAIATASGSQQGLLSSTDWTTFNNKQNALTNPVTGTGTTNYLPKFTGASTIGNSIITDSGSQVVINTATSTTSQFRIENTSFAAGQTMGIDFTVGGGSKQAYVRAVVNNGTTAATDLVFGTASGGNNAATVLTLASTGAATFTSSVTANGGVRTTGANGFSDTDGSSTIWVSANWTSSRPAIAVTSNHPLMFLTNNIERMRLDASGNLGLGVTPSAWASPTYRAFQIGSTAALFSASGQVLLDSNSYVDSSFLDIYASTGVATRYQQVSGQHRWYNAPSGTAGNAISFTQAMTLDASGRLGIGTTSPSYKLQVNGASGTIARITDGTNNLDFYAGSSLNEIAATTSLLLSTNGATRLTIASTGAATFSSSVTAGGLLTTAYTSTGSSMGHFIVNTAASTLSNSSDIWFGTWGGSTISGITNARISALNVNAGNAATDLLFYTWNGSSSGERFRIASSGAATFSSSVDIGQSATVRGFAGTTGAGMFMAYGSAGAGIGSIYSYNYGTSTYGGTVIDGSYVAFYNSGSEKMRVTGGNVGIGTTSPSVKLQVISSLNSDVAIFSGANLDRGLKISTAAGTNNDDIAILNAQTSTGTLAFQTASTERMRITSAGNVGIGTTSPSEKLEVNGISLLENIQIGTTSAFLSNSVNAMIGWASSFSGYSNGTLILQSRSSAATPIVFATGSTSASERMIITSGGNIEINTGSIKTGEPDTGWGRAAIKIGARVSGTAFGVGGYLPVSVDGTVYYINLNSSTP